jgi:hypothetical protein
VYIRSIIKVFIPALWLAAHSDSRSDGRSTLMLTYVIQADGAHAVADGRHVDCKYGMRYSYQFVVVVILLWSGVTADVTLTFCTLSCQMSCFKAQSVARQCCLLRSDSPVGVAVELWLSTLAHHLLSLLLCQIYCVRQAALPVLFLSFIALSYNAIGTLLAISGAQAGISLAPSDDRLCHVCYMRKTNK